MNKTLALLVKIVATVLLIGIFGWVTATQLDSLFVQIPYALFLLAFAGLLVYASILEYLGVPGINGSVRYTSATQAVLYWDVYSSAEWTSEEFIILRKVESNGSFVEVGRSYGPTFTDTSVDSTKTNFYQIFEGRDAMEGKNRMFTPILELKPFKN